MDRLHSFLTSSNSPSIVNTSIAVPANAFATLKLLSNANLVPALSAKPGLCGPAPPGPGGISNPGIMLGIA